jgi:hypothetical protein
MQTPLDPFVVCISPQIEFVAAAELYFTPVRFHAHHQ